MLILIYDSESFICLDMILLCVDHWVNLDEEFQVELVEFIHKLFLRPGALPSNLDDSCFGMSCFEPFKRLKSGLAYHFNVNESKISLFWENNELQDEETPEDIGMEIGIVKREELHIHIDGYEIEN